MKSLSDLSGIFGLVYADPPWKYSFSKSRSRRVENHYETMSLQEIKDLPVKDIAAVNSVLYLWATAPKLPQALEVLSAWGFDYKSHIVWDKVNIGMGYWARGRHELLLIGTKKKGRISPPLPGDRIPSIITSKRTRHSKKPDCVYDYLEKAHPDLNKIELFARNKREGWISWGLEV